jgi:cell division protein ZapA (FtsZ GTPase activity inhibitor)
MHVTVGGMRIRVPLYRNEETTLYIVEQVNQRLKEIEEQSTRIDSQRFALQAAFSFAAELAQAEADRSDDSREMATALDRIATSLQRLLDNYTHLAP